jgi:hypothetical protein
MNWLSNIRMAYKILCLAFVAAIGLAAVSFTGFSSLAEGGDNGQYTWAVPICRHSSIWLRIS